MEKKRGREWRVRERSSPPAPAKRKRRGSTTAYARWEKKGPVKRRRRRRSNRFKEPPFRYTDGLQGGGTREKRVLIAALSFFKRKKRLGGIILCSLCVAGLEKRDYYYLERHGFSPLESSSVFLSLCSLTLLTLSLLSLPYPSFLPFLLKSFPYLCTITLSLSFILSQLLGSSSGPVRPSPSPPSPSFSHLRPRGGRRTILSLFELKELLLKKWATATMKRDPCTKLGNGLYLRQPFFGMYLRSTYLGELESEKSRTGTIADFC